MKIIEAKQQLKEIISKLDEFDDNDECFLEINDNCGGSYIDEFKNFVIQKGSDNIIYINNPMHINSIRQLNNILHINNIHINNIHIDNL